MMVGDGAKQDVAEEGWHQPPEQDMFLDLLVDIVNDSNIELSITLNVGGTIISGTLVSWESYFDGLISDLSGASGVKEVSTALQNGVKKYVELSKEAIQESAREGGVTYTSYIHLKNAKFVFGGSEPIPSNRGVWWRGRLSEVQGFLLGSIT